MAERTRPDGEGFRITRIMDAPREAVWREWTEPEAFADWYGTAAAEVPVSTVSMDVRPGGEWRAIMYAPPNRREISWRGSYHEVSEPERLVFTVTDQPEDDRFDLVTVELTDLGDGRTEMVVEQRGWMSPEGYERAKQGWTGFFERMAERLAQA
jgi:uncharacterized protein YndB with AHSA1/START domain